MSTLTIALPDDLDAALSERLKSSGAHSREEYLLGLVESDCAAGGLERVLAERMGGQFAPLEPDWKERVRLAPIRGAHASRMLVLASRRNELCKATNRSCSDGWGSSSRRDAETNTRDGRAPRNTGHRAHYEMT